MEPDSLKKELNLSGNRDDIFWKDVISVIRKKFRFIKTILGPDPSIDQKLPEIMSETLRDIAINHSISLVERSQKGDNHAFGKLVGLWFKRIYNFTLKYFGDHDLAMEVTQRTFISVYDHLDSLKNAGSFKYWIYKIAINQCHEEDRRQKRRNWFSLFRNDEANKIEEINMNPEKEYNQKEMEEVMNRLLKMIPEEQKVVIIMKEYEGLKFREIAETLGISENTAKSRLYYGLNSLKKLLDKKGITLEKL